MIVVLEDLNVGFVTIQAISRPIGSTAPSGLTRAGTIVSQFAHLTATRRISPLSVTNVRPSQSTPLEPIKPQLIGGFSHFLQSNRVHRRLRLHRALCRRGRSSQLRAQPRLLEGVARRRRDGRTAPDDGHHDPVRRPHRLRIIRSPNWQLVVAAVLVAVVRPISGLVALIRFDRPWTERTIIFVYGLRGIGMLYYLSFGLNEAAFQSPRMV